MTNFNRISRFLAVFLMTACLGSTTLRATSFSYTPDTLTFTPTSTDSVIAYVEIGYNGDTTGPGTNIHCWISSGTSYFGCPTDTVHTRSYFYLRVAYKPQSSNVYGTVTISDDTVTRTVYLIGNAYVAEDAYLSGYGPYFPTNVLEGHDTCTTMRLINAGTDHDTIVSAGWTHNPNGIFTWDSVSLPLTMPSHDTVFWTLCFNAPNNTTLYTDTFVVYYHDSASQTRYVSRVVSAQAYVPEDGYLSGYGPYFPTNVLEGHDTCTTMRLVNTGSDHDTIISAGWTHNPNGIFTWDTASLPLTMPSHDTVTWTFCFNAPNNTTLYTDTFVVYYHDSASQTRYVSRVVSAQAYVPEDGYLSGVGPYFPTNVLEGHDTCTTMRLINFGTDHDTIVSAGWTHNPNGIFTWDTASLPITMPSHDTVTWTFCFNAPNNTNTYTDTFLVYYHDSASQTRYTSRIIQAAAVVPSDGELQSYGPYFPTNVLEGHDTCTTMRLVNSGTDVDTIESMTWSHNPNGIFTWDSVSMPYGLGSHDTTFWTYCFNAPNNTTLYIDTLTVRFHDAASQTRYITRIIEGEAYVPEDGTLNLYSGPYFPEVVDEGHDTCSTMSLINSGYDVDTIVSATWSHNPNGIFTWDSVSIPTTIGSHDTDIWTFCFNAPNDTNLYIDTFTVQYHDAYSQTRYSTRIVQAKATDPSIVTCYSLYATTFAVTNVGDTSYIHMRIRNDLSSSATLTGCHISGTDDGAFRVDSSSFPTTIASDSYDSVLLKFIPNRTSGETSYNSTLTASFTTTDTSHCREATVSLLGYMSQACSDTATVSIDTTGTDDVDVSGDSASYYAHRIDVVNNSSAPLVVTNVGWTDSSSHFLISQRIPSNLPDTIAAGGELAIIIHFYGDTGQVYYDTLALTITNGIAWHGGKATPMSAGTMLINVKGVQTAAPASVSTIATPNAPNLLLYPNPSSGIVNMQLDGATNATFEVFDVLGNVMVSHVGSGTWQWDASGLTSNGTYFVRATSGDAIATKRLVLQR